MLYDDARTYARGGETMRDLWSEFQRMHDELDHLFTSMWGGLPDGRSRPLLADNSASALAYRQPMTDLFETDKEVVATLELPGVDKKDIDIEVVGDGLDVKVEKKAEQEEKKKGVYRVERRYAGFYRHIPLPADVETGKVSATYKNGVLEIRVPKKKGAKSSKIPVK